MSGSEFRARLETVRKNCLPEIERRIQDCLGKSEIRLCGEMTAYHLKTGGKRLRALIPSLVYDAMGRDPLSAAPLGAAVEMVHNATLVHDDLQDGDRIRRDQPTVWARYSEAQAVNCGDAMFQYAYQLLATLDIPPERLLTLVRRLAASTLRVIEGQAQEFLMKEESFPGVERYFEVVRGKTSGLFSFPAVAALEALEAEPSVREAAERVAGDMGVLFQIQDDILDVYGEKGRGTRASDVAEGKISIFVAHVFREGTPEEKAELAAILRTPRESTSAADIDRAVAIYERNQGLRMAGGHLRRILDSASQDRALTPAPRVRELLLGLGEHFLEPVNGLL